MIAPRTTPTTTRASRKGMILDRQAGDRRTMPAMPAMPAGLAVKSPRFGLLALALVVVAAGCGGVELERTPGAKVYRALPLGTPVVVAEASAELPQPTEAVGILRVTTTTPNASQDKANAVEQLKRFAARYGCDAVVAVQVATSEKLFKRKVKKLGADGRPVYEEEVRRSYDHAWQAQCVRTAAAPETTSRSTVATTNTTGSSTSTGSTSGRSATGGGSSTSGGNTAATGKEATGKEATGKEATGKEATGTAATGTAGKGTTGANSTGNTPSGAGTGARANSGASSSTGGGGVIAAAPADDTDPAMASEVARAFLAFSRYVATSNHAAICDMIDKERLYLDIRIDQPALEIKTDLPHDAACAALKDGDLALYVRNFGPAEVHTEMPTLIPVLFRVHGGAFLKLSDDKDQLYRQKVEESRAGKTPLACEMYTVHAAGNLFKISLDCRGVKSYRILLRRDGPDDFKLMALTHNR